MSKLLEKNPLLELISKYPWLGTIQHNINDLNAHLEALNKKFDQQLYKQQIVSGVYFNLGILEKYREKYLKSIPIMLNGNIAHTWIFQIDYNLIVCFMMGRTDDGKLFILPDFHSTCLGLPYNFILDNADFIVDVSNKPLGFGG